MRRGHRIVLAALGLFGLSGAASGATAFEQQVLVALNQARADPSAYARSLQHYRTYFRANLLHYPGQDTDIETQEGVKVVDEAIAFLANRAPLQPVQSSALLGATAGDLVADQSGSGETGHEGADGSSPGDRARRHGGGLYVAEVIAYGPIDAADVVRQLIVDDGVADRGHRTILYSTELRFAGVACGPHPEFRTMCVIDLGATADGREPGGSARTAARD
jgi:uncharacterized protein YkwD